MMIRLQTILICLLLPITALSFSSSPLSSQRTFTRHHSTTTTTDAPQQQQQEETSNNIAPSQYTALTSWFASIPNTFLSSKFQIRPSSSGGYGAFVSRSVSRGELLLRIPRAACVTIDVCLNDVDAGDSLRKLREAAGPGSDTVIMAGYLAKEYLMGKEVGDECDGGESNGSAAVESSSASEPTKQKIAFRTYLESLPWEAGVNGQDHVLFWSEECVEDLLRGSLAYEDAMEIRSSVQYATKILNNIIGPTINKARGIEPESSQEGFRLPWQKPDPKPDIAVDGLEEAIRGAFVICLSRGFARTFRGDEGTDNSTEEEECLVPFLDILQHSNTPNCSDENSPTEPNTIEVRAMRDMEAGEELFNQYKDEEDSIHPMPYHKFFTRFGFVPGVVEPIVNLVKRRSPIFFPKQEVL